MPRLHRMRLTIMLMCTTELQILPEGNRQVGQYFVFQLRPRAIAMYTAAVDNFVCFMNEWKKNTLAVIVFPTNDKILN